MSLRGLRAQLSRPVALLVILAAVPSCSGLLGGKTVIREHRKFVVDDSIPLNASMPQLSEKPYPYKVAVERFEVSRWYDQDKVVFRLSQQELRDDSYLRWAPSPQRHDHGCCRRIPQAGFSLRRCETGVPRGARLHIDGHGEGNRAYRQRRPVVRTTIDVDAARRPTGGPGMA